MSRRPEQLADVIQHELNNFFIKELEFPQDLLITLTQVKISPDLKHAYLYLSVLPIFNTGKALKLINNNLGRARSYLSRRLKIWKCPDLKAVVDDSALKDRKVERVIEELHK